jgi:hypothetical protein
MNTKRWVIASIVVFVVHEVISYLVHGVLLSGVYQATASLWRPMAEMNQMMWIMWVGDLVWVFLLVYIFIKGYEAKGWLEGLRFGLLFGVFFSLPMALGSYAMMPMPFSLAVYWFVFGIIEISILGIITSLIYKK